MSKKSLLITLAFVLLVGLAAMGIAYGAWTDTLTINGNVETGTFGVEFETPVVNNNAHSFATCQAALSGDNKILTITIENAYPGFDCNMTAGIENIGSIPARVTGFHSTADPNVTIGVSDVTIAAGAVADAAFYFEYLLPYDAEVPMGQTIDFTYTVPVAIQP